MPTADLATVPMWYDEHGQGDPCVLLHPGGGSSDSWRPVLGRLAERRRVVAFDIPGFGRTPAPPDIEYSLEWVLDRFEQQLQRAGVATPVDLAGNSMGGWIALEAAKRGLARSVVALGPAGLWDHGMPKVLQNQFRVMLLGCRALRAPGQAVLRLPQARRAALYAIVARPERISYDAVVSMVRTFDHSRPVLEPLLRASRTMSFRDGQGIACPITIAYGAQDRMVHPPGPSVRAQLPAHTRWLDLPGCGHVPMSDNPELVARTILEGSASREASGTRTQAA